MDTERIKELASELQDKRAEKADLENKVKQLNAEIKDIEEGSLNSLLQEDNISAIDVDGMKITKTLVYRGGIFKSENKEDFQLLFDTHNEGALKQHLIIDMSAEEAKDAELILGLNGIPYSIQYTIHNATLSSILKQIVEEGQFSTEDFERYKVYPQPKITIK